MDKDFTPHVSQPNEGGKKEKVVAPSSRTLEFIKSFARCYQVNTDTPNTIAGYCLN